MVVAFPYVWRVSSLHGVQTFSLLCYPGSRPPFLASSLKPFLIKKYSALMPDIPLLPFKNSHLLPPLPFYTSHTPPSPHSPWLPPSVLPHCPVIKF